MADESEDRRCAACGGPVRAGRPDIDAASTARWRLRSRRHPAPPREVEDVNDDITPVQRFEVRHPAARCRCHASKRPSRRAQKGRHRRLARSVVRLTLLEFNY